MIIIEGDSSFNQSKPYRRVILKLNQKTTCPVHPSWICPREIKLMMHGNREVCMNVSVALVVVFQL